MHSLRSFLGLLLFMVASNAIAVDAISIAGGRDGDLDGDSWAVGFHREDGIGVLLGGDSNATEEAKGLELLFSNVTGKEFYYLGFGGYKTEGKAGNPKDEEDFSLSLGFGKKISVIAVGIEFSGFRGTSLYVGFSF